MKQLYFLWLLSYAFLPFFRGGYFYYEAFIFGLIQSVVFLSLLLMKQLRLKYKGFRSFYLIILISALVSSIGAVDLGMHFLGLLKLSVPFLFILSYDSFYEYFKATDVSINIGKEIMTISVVAGVVMTVTVAVSLILPESVSPLVSYFVQGNRIGGFLQYANTFGLYLFALLVYTFFSVKNSRLKFIIAYCLMTGIFLSQSRGTLIGLSLYMLLLVITELMVLKQFKEVFLHFTSFLLSAVTSHLIMLVTPVTIDMERVGSISPQASEWLTRLLYYKDAIQMLIEYPLGYGHLGYYYVERIYQTGSPYLVKYVHSGLLQMGLDYGILALFAFLLLGGWFMRPLYGIDNPADPSVKSKARLFQIGMVLVFLRTWVDFDMEFIIIGLFIVIGLLRLEEYDLTPDVQNDVKPMKTIKTLLIMGVGSSITLLFLFFSWVTYAEYQGNSYLAYRLYPHYTQAVNSLITVTDSIETMTIEDKEAMVQQAVKRNPAFLNGVAFLANNDYNNNKLESSSTGFKRTTELAPLWLDYLYDYMFVTLKLCEKLHAEGKLTRENTDLLTLLSVESYLISLQMTRSTTFELKNKSDFKLTYAMQDIITQSKALYSAID